MICARSHGSGNPEYYQDRPILDGFEISFELFSVFFLTLPFELKYL